VNAQMAMVGKKKTEPQQSEEKLKSKAVAGEVVGHADRKKRTLQKPENWIAKNMIRAPP
jgi:hypothetical protein